jgi:hypothetical protein
MVMVIVPGVTVTLGEIASTVTTTGAGLTVTAAEALAEPPGPLALIE